MKNPYYKFNIGDGSGPNFSNQISGHTGWHFKPQLDNCVNPNSLYDQSLSLLLKKYQPKPVGSLPLADASITAEGITGNQISTPIAEGLGDPDELVGYAQPLQPELTTEDPSVGVFDSSKWNVKRGAVRKEGAVAIPFQAQNKTTRTGIGPIEKDTQKRTKDEMASAAYDRNWIGEQWQN